ncbi:arrestin domain-containing protein 2-like isoform X2 [Fopius arisanus]|uniref:Arrestin domain-containing protein 2-like isoform X2 n=1 Tax=Fopius arisanus TaxID=64838 RepID=A0A9R1U0K1_9HYME|nr:PREDICTED: arrestin domain-containing protein 2-like isoform X2 [Fopius arisanus]
MVLKSFHIKLHNATGTYAPGEVVSGDVIIVISKKNQFCLGIKLQFKGKAEVQWTGSDTSGNHCLYLATESYFLAEDYIYQDRNEDSGLTPGQHMFPFTFLLPNNIPDSFYHKNGSVDYSINAIMEEWDSFPAAKIKFNVKSLVEPHQYPPRPIIDECSQTYWSCLLPCISAGSMTVKIRISGSTYAVGDSIDTLIDIHHNIIDFHSTSPCRDTKHKEETVKSGTLDGPYGTDEIFEMSLQVPCVPLSGLRHCNLIDISYRLRILIYVNGCPSRLAREYDIVIGSRSESSSIPYNGATGLRIPIPSAPPIQHNTPETPPPSYQSVIAQQDKG